MCTVCKHYQIKDIDRALLTGASLTSLSQKYGFSTSALHRHQEHLGQKMAQAQKRFYDGLHQGLFCKLNIVLELVLHVVRGANAGGDFKLFLQASREVTRLISLMIKMKVQLEPEMIYCLMASPQWGLQDSLLPNAFQALSDTRQTLAVNLFAPCPEPEPEIIPDTTQRSPLETQNPKLETSKPQAPQIKTENRKLEAENRPPKQREKTAKLARKNAPSKIFIEKYHEDMVCEKIARKNRAISRSDADCPNLPTVSSCPDPAATVPSETRNSKLGTFFQKLCRQWEDTGKLPGKTIFNQIII